MMAPERLRWTDSRLDDRFETVVNELRVLRDVPANMAELREQMRQLRRDVDNCSASVREHRDAFGDYVEQQDKTHEAHRLERKADVEAQRLERKSDRRWMVGTILTSAALVIAAMGLLVGHL